MIDEINKDEQYQIALDSLKTNRKAYDNIKTEVFNRLQTESPAYRKAIENRDRARSEFNLALLRHTAQYYESRGEVISMDKLKSLPWASINTSRELELLRWEMSYACAIVSYYKNMPENGTFPENIDDMF